ncbi:MAG: hypothetical protein CME62_07405 [Halobacteriovoraceae bacterium]|nr:hypothetical protein [Halobacteriovoraceae bacterium]|tara:strand:+ start:32260 stop:33648 length:1389 start_codon:yes stop_codon:yes gene_type:complete
MLKYFILLSLTTHVLGQELCRENDGLDALDTEALENLLRFNQSCNRLQPGHSRVFNNVEKTIANNGHHASYKLTRSSSNPNQFIASINPVFYFHETLSNGQVQRVPVPSARDNQLTREMLDKVQGCLDEVNGSLLGPFGQELTIEIQRSNQSSNPPPRVGIQVYDYEIERADTETWSQYTDCQTIVHEIFHYLGLPDSYHEEGIGYYFNSAGQVVNAKSSSAETFKPLYDCRAIGPEDSIMNNQYQAYERLGESLATLYEDEYAFADEQNYESKDVSKYFFQVERMLGSYNEASINYHINTLRSENRLSTLNQSQRQEFESIYSQINQLNTQLASENLRPPAVILVGGAQFNSNQPTITHAQRVARLRHYDQQAKQLYRRYNQLLRNTGLAHTAQSSLLYPAEFINIVSTGSCFLTQTFEQCSQNAYSTSFAQSISGYQEWEVCSNTPHECSSGDGRWLQLD